MHRKVAAEARDIPGFSLGSPVSAREDTGCEGNDQVQKDSAGTDARLSQENAQTK